MDTRDGASLVDGHNGKMADVEDWCSVALGNRRRRHATNEAEHSMGKRVDAEWRDSVVDPTEIYFRY
jgi:hypothetical protein